MPPSTHPTNQKSEVIQIAIDRSIVINVHRYIYRACDIKRGRTIVDVVSKRYNLEGLRDVATTIKAPMARSPSSDKYLGRGFPSPSRTAKTSLREMAS
jgi:hypothetical protein